MADANLDQHTFAFRNDDNVDPDDCTLIGSTINSTTGSISIGTKFMVRIGLDEDANRSGTPQLSPYYQVNSTAGSWVLCTTSSNAIRLADGTPPDGATCNSQRLDSGAAGSWTNGLYRDSTGSTSAISQAFGKEDFTELQWCVVGMSTGLTADDLVYFRIQRTGGDTVTLSYSVQPQITLTAAGTTHQVTLSSDTDLASSFSFSRTVHGALDAGVTAADQHSGIANLTASILEALTLSDTQAGARFVEVALASALTTLDTLSPHRIQKAEFTAQTLTADVLTVAIRLGGILSEGITVSDSQAASLTAVATLEAPLTLSDTQAPLRRILAALSSDVTLADTEAVARKIGVEILGAVTVGDVWDMLRTLHASWVETAAVHSTRDGLANFLMSRTDPVILSAVFDYLTGLEVDLESDVTLADVLSVSLLTQWSESLTLSDLWNAGLLIPANLTETLTVADTSTAALVLHTALTEALTLADTEAVQRTIHASWVETTTAGDTPVGVGELAGLLESGLTLADLMAFATANEGVFASGLTLRDAYAIALAISQTEQISLSAAFSAAVPSVAMAAGLTLSDTWQSVSNLVVSITETVRLGDSWSIPTELVTLILTDALTHTAGLSDELRDTLATGDTGQILLALGDSLLAT